MLNFARRSSPTRPPWKNQQFPEKIILFTTQIGCLRAQRNNAPGVPFNLLSLLHLTTSLENSGPLCLRNGETTHGETTNWNGAISCGVEDYMSSCLPPKQNDKRHFRQHGTSSPLQFFGLKMVKRHAEKNITSNSSAVPWIVMLVTRVGFLSHNFRNIPRSAYLEAFLRQSPFFLGKIRSKNGSDTRNVPGKKSPSSLPGKKWGSIETSLDKMCWLKPGTEAPNCSPIFEGIPSLKLTARPWKQAIPKRKLPVYSIHFQGLC